MNPLLALPHWNGLHPAMIHFPVALLLVAPVFVLLGAFLEREKGRIFLLGALILMLLGTAATFLARSTGEAAAQQMERTPAIAALIEQHEELAETTSVLFLALTAIFAAIVYGLHRLQQARATVLVRLLPLVFLLLYGAGAALLVDTGHRGGRLVHEFGVRALLPPQGSPVSAVRPQPEK
jgi:uncharacterized membrane protein